MSNRLSIELREKSTNRKLGHYQVLGNNEFSNPLRDELIRQGAIIDSEGCLEGKITELQPIIDKLEEYIFEKEEHFNALTDFDGKAMNIFDLTPTEDERINFTNKILWKQKHAYIFASANLINFLSQHGALAGSVYEQKHCLKDEYELLVFFN